MPVQKRSSEYSNRSSASEALSGRTVGELTGKTQGGQKIGRNSSLTKAYINDAFSFLEADEYNPYKRYSKVTDDNNILRIKLDDQDHSKRTELRLTSSGGQQNNNNRPKRSSDKRSSIPPVPSKHSGQKSPVLAPYITSINVQNNPAPDTGSISTHSSAHSRTLFHSSPSPLSNVQPIGLAGTTSEKSVSNGKGGAVPLHVSSVSYDNIDGLGKKSDDMGFCSRKRCFCLVIVLVCFVIVAAAVACAVYFVVKENQNTTPEPYQDTTTVLTESNQFIGMITYNEDWSDDLSNTSSPRYQQIAQTVKEQIQSALSGSEYDDCEIEITDIRPGSIEVWFRLVLRVLTSVLSILNSLQEGLNKVNEEDSSMNMTGVDITALPPLTTTNLPTTTRSTTTSVDSTTPSSTTPMHTTTVQASTSTASTSSSTPVSSTSTTVLSSTTTAEKVTESTSRETTSTIAVESTTSTSTSTSVPSTTTTVATTSTTMATESTTMATESTSTASQSTTIPNIVSTTTATTTTTEATTTLYIPTDTRTTPAKADQCDYIAYTDCEVNGYVRTGTPNKFRRENTETDDESKLRAIADLVETGCYAFARQFLCATYFPECTDSKQLVFPCRSFCQEFHENCTFPFNCVQFPDDDDVPTCMPRPNLEIETDITEPVPTTCTTRDPLGGFEIQGFLCGNEKCVPLAAFCDNIDHCGDMSDELPCKTNSAIDCDFEDEEDGMCGYTQASNNHFDWMIGEGSTPTIGTGPQYDHTVKSVSGHYLLAEASGRYRLDRSRVLSPSVTFSEEYCLRFYYHMYGESVGSLEVRVKLMSSDEEQLLWERHRSAGNSWRYGYTTLPANQELRVIFETYRGENHLGDVAIDDITAYPGSCGELTCETNEFKCGSSLQCLSHEFLCDGTNDCGDFSDERDCTCSDTEWQCDFGNCIPRLFRCDYKPDCPDKSDEKNCEGCILGQVKCPEQNLCIEHLWLCDGEADCDNGWDESPEVCKNCSAEQFQCRDYGCVDKAAKCDGIYDCADGSDEQYCVRVREEDSVLEIYRDDTFIPLCAEDFPGTRLDEICASLGKGIVDRSVPEPVSSRYYLHWSPASSSQSSASNFLQHLSISGSCYDNQVIAISCMELKCGLPTTLPSPFIVSGEDATLGEWPWQAVLVYKGRRVCGGSLIDEDHILTAAHCVHEKEASDYKISLGTVVTSNVTKTEYLHDVSDYTVHPSYSSFYEGDDIAIITLAESVQYTDYIKPVCLPRETDYIPPNSRCYSTGFGYTDFAQKTYPVTLQKAKMKLVSDKKCAQTYDYFRNEMQCAGYDSGITANCRGDSGGPLVCQSVHGHWQLVGAFSYFVGHCISAYYPPVFTKIQPYLEFIDDSRECVFYCKNGACLLTNSEKCDGHNHCNDYSDEDPELCGASVSCDFESSFLCGYSAVIASGENVFVKTFLPQQGPVDVDSNNGATVDHTLGTIYGTRLEAEKNRAVILSPVLNISETTCLKVHYHMRGELVGQFKIFQVSVSEDVIHPQQVTSLQDSVNKLYLEHHQGATWNQALIDLDPGRSVVGFEAVARQPDYYPTVSIDDIELMDIECGMIGSCSSDEFTCAQSGLCIPASSRCNFHSLCSDESDEEGCDTVAPYTCDFEKYGDCHLEQDHIDDFDWSIWDYGHNGGHSIYMNLDGLSPGYRANLILAIRTPDTESCLSFYYTMDSSGIFRVSFASSSDQYTDKFTRSQIKVKTWTKAEITLDPGVKVIVFSAVSGADGDWEYTGSNYVELDDLKIENSECDAPECEPDDFRCDNGQCIPGIWYCNSLSNCDDNSDEKAGCTCDDRWQFRCKSTGRCINKNQECDLIQHCADSSDELDCTCTNQQFRCNDGRCIEGYKYCDGNVDCTDSEDEIGCSCTQYDFECTMGGCIDSSFRCDFQPDCFDNSDEINCRQCAEGLEGFFECDNGMCIYNDSRCDSINDCHDFSDERGCSCEVNQFQCNNGLCIDTSLHCNGHDDCGDESDEMDCPSCKFGEMMCGDGRCYQTEWHCDGFADCTDSSDEEDCGTCPEGQYQCASYECLDNSKRCDGTIDCKSGSDELGCVGFHTSGSVVNILHALYNGAWLPVCSDVWQDSWSDDICKSMGHGPAIATTTVTVESPQYVKASNTSVKFHSGLLQVASSCVENTVVKVTCEERTCGMREFDSKPTGFIIGGDLAPEGAWPWMGGLYYRGAFVCGVVLIDEYVAISAVHCFFDYDSKLSTANLPNYHTIQFGSNQIYDSSAQTKAVNKIVVHPNYTTLANGFRYDDIAVIQLKTPVTLNDKVNPMCLPDGSDADVHVNDICYHSGWGYSNVDKYEAVQDLREARHLVWSATECNKEENWDNYMKPETQLCAGYSSGNIASCYGDSGSPLMCRDGVGGWKLAGILTLGANDCGQHRNPPVEPSVFTKAASYVPWIKDTIETFKKR